jgi:hypothetical protein
MQTTLPLKSMTKVQKLRAMEELWTDLTRNEGTFESPTWHLKALRETEARVATGKEQFIDWEVAKESLRRRAK